MLEKLKNLHEFDTLISASHVDLFCNISFRAVSDTVVFGGSLVEGFGNARSDIDVFVITGKVEPSDATPYFFWSVANRWVDINYVSSSFFSGLVNEIIRRSGNFPFDFAEFRTLPLKNLDLLHRIGSGLSYGDLFEAKSVRPFLAAELCYVYLAFARSLWDDAVGAYQSGQFEQCIFNCQLMTDQIIDAYTAILGETYVGAKWRWVKMKRLAVDPLSLKNSHAKRCSHSGPISEQMVLQWLDRCGMLIFEVMHLAWKKIPSGLPSLKLPLCRREIYKNQIALITSSGEIKFPV